MTKIDVNASLDVIDLGQMAYAQAMQVQRRTHYRVLQGAAQPTLLLVEHDPVITTTRHTEPSHLKASRQTLAQMGIDVVQTDRGGDVTYHGPGQLVVYPILHLRPLRFNIGRYMHWLEQVIIDTVKTFGVQGFREQGLTGVWVAPLAHMAVGHPAKLCAAGVRIERNVTLHGVALNVTTMLDHYKTIVPCGMAERSVTSLAVLLGTRAPSMDRVKRVLANTVRQHLTHRATSIASSPMS